MTTVVESEQKRTGPAWWLVLIQGILAIIVGFLLWAYPVRTFITLSFFIGFYWLVSGIFDIVFIFFDHRQWGWKLAMGILGIIAGGFLMNRVMLGAVDLAYATALFIGLAGIFYGVLGLIRAFQGGGWGMGILGVVAIIFACFILANLWAAALAIPWLFGLLGIFGGILAIIGAFMLRSKQKTSEVAEEKADVAVSSRTEDLGEVAESAAIPVVEPEAVVAPVVAAVAAIEAKEETAVEPVAEAVAAETVIESTPVESAPTDEAIPTAESEVETATFVDTAEIAKALQRSQVEFANMAEIPAEQAAFLKKEIEYVEGIGPAYGAKLRAIGIATPLDLLSKGATRKGRELIVKATGITMALILKWVNHTDLFRVKGVGSEYADLLEVAGVDTVVELSRRKPTNLHAKMVEMNETKKLVRKLPTEAQVEDWVAQAKQLGRVVMY
jgi:uncharacterized membrane protein HdeD (DUF308 family)/predicted flap endonuclease-1-like 5' DNA nuclease